MIAHSTKGWHTADYLAAQWGKSLRTVQRWAANGFLIECGFKVMQASWGTPAGAGGKGRWYIYIPDEAACSHSAAANLASTSPAIDSHMAS